MALKASVESLDDLPDAVKSEYKEFTDPKTKTTVYILDIDGGIDMLPAARSLKDEAARRRVEAKAATDALGKFKVLGDRDVNEIVTMLDRFPELEAAAAGKLDDTKINGIVETRLKAKLAPLERERDTLKTQVAERDTTIGEYTKKERTRMISGELLKAAREAKVTDSAMEDIELYGDRVFEVTEDGHVVTKDGVGVTPGLSAKDWLSDMQAKRPHWWGPSTGGGANGGRPNGGAGGTNPFTAENWNLTEQGKLVNTDRKRADALAAQAGTTVGGLKPKPRPVK